MKYIDAEKLKSLLDAKYKDFMEKSKIEGYTTLQYQYMADGIDIAEQFIDSLQQENEIVEFTFKGGTYRVNGEEHAFKGGKAKVIILEINQEEGNE